MFRQAGAEPALQPPADAQTFKQKQATTEPPTPERITPLTAQLCPIWAPQLPRPHGRTSTGDTKHPHWHGAATKKTRLQHTRPQPQLQETAQAATS